MLWYLKCCGIQSMLWILYKRIILAAINTLWRWQLLMFKEWLYRIHFSEIWTRIGRNNAFWRYFCNYFPIKLVKTVDLNPNKSHLFVCVPHGILSTGIMGSFGTDVLGCKELFPGLEIRPIILDQHFKVPLFREYPYLLGKTLNSLM